MAQKLQICNSQFLTHKACFISKPSYCPGRLGTQSKSSRSWSMRKAASWALCAVSSVPQNDRSTPACYGSWVSLTKFLVFLAKLPEVNLAEKPNSKLWIWMSRASMLPSRQSLYIALSPSKKGHSVMFVFQFEVQDLGLRAPGFLFHFPMASHLQFSCALI